MRILAGIPIFLIAVLYLFSCDTRETEPTDIVLEMEYFPLRKGVYQVYQVKEISYNLISGNQTKNYFLKEIVADSFFNGANNYTFIINRYKKDNLQENWKIDSAWSSRIQGNQIIKVENNVPYVKLVFPVSSGKTWNGNAYNIKGEEIYKMDSVGKPKTINNLPFDNTLVQYQKKDSSSISQDYRVEVYAKGVGMIHKKSIITTNHQENGSLVFPIKIDMGLDLTQTIIEYGKE